jgi:glycosyltransferase involved in cell wall biosynthesis
MAYGKPLIASNIGGISELVKEGENGYLFNSGNHIELYSKLKKFTSLQKDEKVMMGRMSRMLVEQVNGPDIFYDKLLHLYDRVLLSN